MSLDSYSGLVAEVGDWLDRDDVATRAPTFVRLVEAKVNRRLSDPDQETTFTTTASGDYTALPADFGEMVSISTGVGRLDQVSGQVFAGYPAITGDPRSFSIVNNSIAFAPHNATTPITMVYRKRVPALTAAAPTNWLLARAPDVYFYGVMAEACGFDVEDQRAAKFEVEFERALDELITDGMRRRFGSGPIAPRIRRT